MSETKLSTASYLVLGLVEMAGSASPYELKDLAARSVSLFWALPHTQIYTQCDRLTQAGLLDEEREEDGRRRRVLTINKAGRAALDEWRNSTPDRHYELRDEAILKLFFGGDAREIAELKVPEHEARLAYFAEIEKISDTLTDGQRLALEIGIGHEREYLRFWRAYLKRQGGS